MDGEIYFTGKLKLNRTLEGIQLAYLQKFSSTRRMKRNVEVLKEYSDPIREATGLPLGKNGDYFVAQDDPDHDDPSILEYNDPPKGQPGLWCSWSSTGDGKAIEWNGSNDPFNYKSWLEYLIQHFLKPWGYELEGRVEWEYTLYRWSEKRQEDLYYIEIGEIVVEKNDVHDYFLKQEARDEENREIIKDFDFTEFEKEDEENQEHFGKVEKLIKVFKLFRSPQEVIEDSSPEEVVDLLGLTEAIEGFSTDEKKLFLYLLFVTLKGEKELSLSKIEDTGLKVRKVVLKSLREGAF